LIAGQLVLHVIRTPTAEQMAAELGEEAVVPEGAPEPSAKDSG
jgi:hypothetical protein